ncbi:His/Gly/Thr/Pro-type tRNA ligase C-terminal domain-containing protein, partial [Streptomyces galilaeus]|uniref:His/Gly/Thr/Pro-type tRNA ligase C-terminal domain-containing protein n=1 Tax=Streptomyces galilaeus TaxID=33899 RepID=UPI0038F7D7CF
DRVADRLRGDGYRVEVAKADEGVGARVRKGRNARVPYLLVVGDEDVEAGTVGVNSRGAERPEKGVRVEEFADRLAAEV